jgi:hypothetical protein
VLSMQGPRARKTVIQQLLASARRANAPGGRTWRAYSAKAGQPVELRRMKSFSCRPLIFLVRSETVALVAVTVVHVLLHWGGSTQLFFDTTDCAI